MLYFTNEFALELAFCVFKTKGKCSHFASSLMRTLSHGLTSRRVFRFSASSIAPRLAYRLSSQSLYLFQPFAFTLFCQNLATVALVRQRDRRPWFVAAYSAALYIAAVGTCTRTTVTRSMVYSVQLEAHQRNHFRRASSGTGGHFELVFSV